MPAYREAEAAAHRAECALGLAEGLGLFDKLGGGKKLKLRALEGHEANQGAADDRTDGGEALQTREGGGRPAERGR